MRKYLIAAAILVAAFLLIAVSLPPNPVRIPLDTADPDLRARTVRGAYHIHTTRSDGAEDKQAIAAAAARAGLQFAIFTDHGDGTRPPDAPAYLSGVLCIDGVEISTNGGHYVALDIPAAAYPLGGEASAVVEDVARLGGFGIVAHPDHPRKELRWEDWGAAFDGVEWINADSEWRDESPLTLARALATYPLRPAPALALVLDRPTLTIQMWDGLSRRRRAIAFAAVDAHGGTRTRSTEHGESRAAAGPSYEASFRSLTNRVMLDQPLTGDAERDARSLMDAIREGRVYSVVDAISPDVLLRAEGPTGMLVPAVPLPTGMWTSVLAGDGHARLEISAPRAPGEPPVPWVLTNWVGPVPEPFIPPVPDLSAAVPLELSAWRVEKDPASSGRVSGAGSLVTLEYRLDAAERASQFVAAAADLPGDQAFRAIAFRGHASAPMRVSVQLRFEPDDRRWVTSVYLDPGDRHALVPVPRMVAAEGGRDKAPATTTARSILFVVDLVNARPGAAGSFTISDLRGLEQSPSTPR